MICKAKKVVANLPQFRKGWTTPDGKTKKGFWQFRHEGKYVSLVKWGSPTTEGGKAEFQLACEARDRFLADQAKVEYQKTLEAPTEYTVWHVIENYLANQLPKTSAHFQRQARYHLVEFQKLWGRLEAEKVTPDHIKTWEAKHQWGDGGRRAALTPIKAAFRLAYEEGRIKVNPVGRIKTKSGQPRQEIFANDEWEKFLNACKPQWKLFFQAVRECPSRPGEIATLRGRHVRQTVGGNVVFILAPHEWKNGKKANGKERVIPLLPKWQTWATKRAEEVGPDGYLFSTAWGTQIVYTQWAWAFRQAAEKAGLRSGLDTYTIRHTAITAAISAGIPVAKIAAMFGTSSHQIETTYSKYFRASDDMCAMLATI